MFPMLFYAVDIEILDCLKFLYPPSDIGRNDVEVLIECKYSDDNKETLVYKVWVNVGNCDIMKCLQEGCILPQNRYILIVYMGLVYHILCDKSSGFNV